MKFVAYGFVFDPEIDQDRSISSASCRTADALDGRGICLDKFGVDISVVGNMGCGAGIEVPEIFGICDVPSCHVCYVV